MEKPVNVNLKCIREIIKLDTVESTQNCAKELAKEGYPSNTLIIADIQTKGRGRFDSSWDSAEGGIYFSLILRPKVLSESLAELNIKTAKVISETIKTLYNIKTRIKPPNDVLAFHPVQKKFMKIAGVLIESSSAGIHPDWIIIGAGINLNNNIAPELKEAVSVKRILKKEVSKEEFLKTFFDFFWDKFGEWETQANLKLQ
jgi:BirA family biotin operon repressor/biotin-[acetyl-CoA-carboxylase] ligase